MTSCKRGDIVLVPFPFSDQSTSKKRPAVIISSDTYNELSADCVIMAITSQTRKTIGMGECLLNDWRDAGLLKPSAIKPAISSIEKTLILKKLGRLSSMDYRLMEEALKELLSLG